MEKEATSKTEEGKQEAAAQNFKFPEVQGDGHAQYDPASGWCWIGINLKKFSFRDAWAFVKSQEFLVATSMSRLEQERMIRQQITSAQPKQQGALRAVAAKLGIKV